jgi:hypothetical protein
MENFCAIHLRLVYINTKCGSHLTEGHIVLKGLCRLLLVRASFIASELTSLLLAVAVIQRRRQRHIFFPAVILLSLILIYSFKYNQQDATLYNILYYCQCSTCFGRFLRPSSGALNCIYSIGYMSSLLAATAASKLDKYQMLCVQF